jgi:hypothetical protein
LGIPLDLGASWIHGVNGNPLSELADFIGAQRSVTDYESHRVRDAQGTVVVPSDFTNDFVEVATIQHEFAADAVLVTVPLGVLKSGSIDFQPPLDRDHQGAIDRLGMDQRGEVHRRSAQRAPQHVRNSLALGVPDAPRSEGSEPQHQGPDEHAESRDRVHRHPDHETKTRRGQRKKPDRSGHSARLSRTVMLRLRAVAHVVCHRQPFTRRIGGVPGRWR